MQTIDLIVPTIQGREASLQRCVSSFEEATPSGQLNVIVVPDSKTCGWGWRQGLVASRAPYVALVADDIECVSDAWSHVCKRVADAALLPCPRVYRPDGVIESQGGDMNALGHIVSRHRKDRAACDFTTVPFLNRRQAEQIGMIDTQYCCDVWVSYRGRQLGYQTVLCHGYDLMHYQEQVGRGAGMAQHDRDEMDRVAMFAELQKYEEVVASGG